MNTPLAFPNATCSLVSLREQSEGRIVPRLAIFVGETLPARIVNSMPMLDQSELEEGIVPIYYIADIIPHQDNSNLVDVIFGIAHELFEEANDPENNEVEPWLAARYSVTIPLQYVLIARAMSQVDPEFFLMICAEDATPENLTKVRTPKDNCIFVIDFPPTNLEETSERVKSVLEDVSLSVYAASDEDDDPLNDHISPSVRSAQYNLLNILCSLRSGSIVGGWRMLDSFSERINQHISANDSDSEEQSQDYEIGAFIHLARMACLSSTPPRDGDPDLERTADEDDPDDAVLSSFAKIMEANELDKILDAVDDTNPYYVGVSSQDVLGLLDPFAHGIPESMQELFAHIAQTEPVVLDLVRWDWSRSEVFKMAFDNHAMSDIVKAMLLVVAARLNMMQSAYPKQRKTLGTVRFLTSRADGYPWEILAMKDPLSHYETGTFTDLLETTYGEDDDIHSAVYLFVTLRQIHRLLEEEEWTASNLDARLNSIDLRLRSLPNMRSLLLVLLEEHNDEEDDEDDEVPPEIAAVMGAMHSFDISFLANNLSLLVPTLADIAAASNSLEVGSAEWNDFRNEYIGEFLRGAAYGVTRQGLGAF